MGKFKLMLVLALMTIFTACTTTSDRNPAQSTDAQKKFMNWQERTADPQR